MIISHALTCMRVIETKWSYLCPFKDASVSLRHRRTSCPEINYAVRPDTLALQSKHFSDARKGRRCDHVTVAKLHVTLWFISHCCFARRSLIFFLRRSIVVRSLPLFCVPYSLFRGVHSFNPTTNHSEFIPTTTTYHHHGPHLRRLQQRQGRAKCRSQAEGDYFIVFVSCLFANDILSISLNRFG
jgi:hypothetical protein